MLPFVLTLDTDALPNKAHALANASSPLIAQAAPAPQANRRDKIFPYATIQLGVGLPQSFGGNLNAGGVPTDTNLNLNTGFNGEAAIGYQIHQTRAELAVGYGNYGVNSQTFDNGTLSVANSGAVQATTVMLNGYYDFPIYLKKAVKSRWSPYIGAGIGYANINTPACDNGTCFAGGSTNGFAYQGKLGVSYRVAQRSFVFLEGGYLGTTAGTIDGVNFNNFGSWRLNMGFRIGFGGGGGGGGSTPSAASSQP